MYTIILSPSISSLNKHKYIYVFTFYTTKSQIWMVKKEEGGRLKRNSKCIAGTYHHQSINRITAAVSTFS